MIQRMTGEGEGEGGGDGLEKQREGKWGGEWGKEKGLTQTILVLPKATKSLFADTS